MALCTTDPWVEGAAQCEDDLAGIFLVQSLFSVWNKMYLNFTNMLQVCSLVEPKGCTTKIIVEIQ